MGYGSSYFCVNAESAWSLREVEIVVSLGGFSIRYCTDSVASQSIDMSCSRTEVELNILM